jgi:hypothetical protein
VIDKKSQNVLQYKGSQLIGESKTCQKLEQ